jgi:peptidoglycan hydrolase-like protein with peptidoglycan-binding domain
MTTIIMALRRNVTILATFLGVSVIGLAFALPVAASAALLTQQLDPGMQNADVTSLQTFLAASPSLYPSGLVTGYYGSLTTAGVSAFQTANNLAAVGRVGPQTLAAINAQMGGTVSTGTSGDVFAPIMTPEVVTASTNSFTVSWTTNESASDRVMFGTTWPFLYATASSVTANGYGTSANITVTGLQSNTTYYYVIQSTDASGNLQETIGKAVTTT